MPSHSTIAPGAKPDQIVVDWKYADARWIDHARAHGMRKLHRLVLQLDESTHTVRGREFHSESGWSAGMDGASIHWKASLEIVFYQYAHERVYGLQVGPDGKLTAALSYAYTFNLREMKDPIIAAVTAASSMLTIRRDSVPGMRAKLIARLEPSEAVKEIEPVSELELSAL